MLQVREHAPTLSPSIIFTFGFIVESIKEFKGASTTKLKYLPRNAFHTLQSNVGQFS
jgi:hypothetical protein